LNLRPLAPQASALIQAAPRPVLLASHEKPLKKARPLDTLKLFHAAEKARGSLIRVKKIVPVGISATLAGRHKLIDLDRTRYYPKSARTFQRLLVRLEYR
jgi:hypothetical protein